MSRNKRQEILNKRARYCQKVVASSKRRDIAVRKLAEQLFISKDTVYNDLKRVV